VRTFLIVFVDEVIELLLLLEEVLGGRLSRFLLERQVHTLVPAILFGMTGPDPLNLDPQPQPPHREPAQSE
jgi:hypothetical protein